MNKIKNYAIMAGFAFAMAFTFSSCSAEDGEDDPTNSSDSANGGTSSPTGGSSSSGGAIASVEINGQVWMAENLNIEIPGSVCYGQGSGYYDYDDEDAYDEETGYYPYIQFTAQEIQANCTKYGRLYTWEAAKTACESISGWRLPSDEDWQELIDYIYEESQGEEYCYGECVGKYLKAKDGWKDDDYYSRPGNGDDVYDFKALPGGFGIIPDNDEENVEAFGYVGSQGYWWSASEHEYDDSYANMLPMSSYSENATLDYDDKERLFSVRCIKE